MRHLTPAELKKISQIFDAGLTLTPTSAKLYFGVCGFRTKKVDVDGSYYDFRFYGLPWKKKEFEDVRSELSNPRGSRWPLTYLVAKRLIGKKVTIGYYNMDEKYPIQIEGMRKGDQERQLIFRSIHKDGILSEEQNFIFERRGVFIGGGAEPLFIAEII
jgi:hypothetical protein